MKNIFIFLPLTLLLFFACKKKDTPAIPVDYRDKWVGKYKCIEKDTGGGISGYNATSIDTISVSKTAGNSDEVDLAGSPGLPYDNGFEVNEDGSGSTVQFGSNNLIYIIGSSGRSAAGWESTTFSGKKMN